MIKQIEKAYRIKKERGWEKIYFIFDIHETILKPSYSNDEASCEFYPYAKEALEIITKQDDIVCIMWSCSSDEKMQKYFDFFKSEGINFDYVNENPEVVNTSLSSFDRKLYCNVGFDDKFGFDAEDDWRPVYEYFKKKIFNKDRNRYYGLRIGDIIEIEIKVIDADSLLNVHYYHKARVIDYGYLDNNKVYVEMLDNGDVFEYVAERCKLITKVEDL